MESSSQWVVLENWISPICERIISICFMIWIINWYLTQNNDSFTHLNFSACSKINSVWLTLNHRVSELNLKTRCVQFLKDKVSTSFKKLKIYNLNFSMSNNINAFSHIDIVWLYMTCNTVLKLYGPLLWYLGKTAFKMSLFE